MSRTIDVLVAGSGLAGLMAALTAAQDGRSVRLVTDGMGSLAISGGCVDLLGYAGGRRLDDPWNGMDLLPPEHPYRLLGAGNIRTALDMLRQCAAEQGWPLHTAVSPQGAPCNALLPTIMGTLKPSYLLPAGLNPTALTRAKRILVAGVRGLRDCRPALIVSQLRRYKDWADKDFIQILLPSPLGETHRSLSALDLARLVDKPQGRDWLIRALREHAGQCDAVLLPPICGSRADASVWHELSQAVGCPLVEMLSIPPGVGGLRLRDALLRELRRHDFELVENARLIRAETNGKQCTALVALAAGQERRHRARAFVLATGGILGGGVELAPGKVRESVFGLDIPVPPDVTEWSEPEIFGSHVFSRLGVRVDGEMRPLDEAGQTRWENVFFAGRSLGGYDFATEKSGHGVALTTGWQAGRMAAAIAGKSGGPASGERI
ncbi:anaerobic glycerol-3-phosphate dehydrogenase subunit GlpB [uncultured Desulfovibrio sp.]|uniref:anaerobic glycerol-3-phosphate dehydrogenase subunit GlpB n=1 Tax=uncultured Desulfovibrio sp. TaxID=167968 RepID=UPI0026718318|nr:anaerobic glycerol-3-phosphate dehydrogenase subunit GlpB [uncultured Desulfovibrio sp.]